MSSSAWSQLSEWTWAGAVNEIATYRLPSVFEGKEQKQSGPAGKEEACVRT